MADTLPNITLPAGQWVDLYAASGVIVGTQVIAQNNGANDIQLSVKATAPTASDGFRVIKRSQELINDAGDSGLWGYCPNVNGLVNVREA